jgi:lysozyme
MMAPSTDLVEFVKGWESCSLAPYLDAVGLLTVGYGHRIPVGGDRTPITQQEADAMLAMDLDTTMRGIASEVNVAWTQQQADALCSLAYNCGVTAIINSHLMALFNAGKVAQAAEEFMRWDHAGGRIMDGLTKRRKAEQGIFYFGDYSGRP